MIITPHPRNNYHPSTIQKAQILLLNDIHRATMSCKLTKDKPNHSNMNIGKTKKKIIWIELRSMTTMLWQTKHECDYEVTTKSPS